MELEAIIVNLKEHYDICLISGCAILGSVKAVVEVNHHKSFCYKAMDTILGIISGILVALHYSNNLSLWFQCGVALIAGALGALETVLQMLPQILSKAVDKYLSVRVDRSDYNPDYDYNNSNNKYRDREEHFDVRDREPNDRD